MSLTMVSKLEARVTSRNAGLSTISSRVLGPNSFEVYPGTDTSKMADRFQNHVMPFFSQNLCFQLSCK
jgi:hypothetical protein